MMKEVTVADFSDALEMQFDYVSALSMLKKKGNAGKHDYLCNIIDQTTVLSELDNYMYLMAPSRPGNSEGFKNVDIKGRRFQKLRKIKN